MWNASCFAFVHVFSMLTGIRASLAGRGGPTRLISLVCLAAARPAAFTAGLSQLDSSQLSLVQQTTRVLAQNPVHPVHMIHPQLLLGDHVGPGLAALTGSPGNSDIAIPIAQEPRGVVAPSAATRLMQLTC